MDPSASSPAAPTDSLWSRDDEPSCRALPKQQICELNTRLLFLATKFWGDVLYIVQVFPMKAEIRLAIREHSSLPIRVMQAWHAWGTHHVSLSCTPKGWPVVGSFFMRRRKPRLRQVKPLVCECVARKCRTWVCNPQCLTSELPPSLHSPSPQANAQGPPQCGSHRPGCSHSRCTHLLNHPATCLEIPCRPHSGFLPKPCFCRVLHPEWPPLEETCPSNQTHFAIQLLCKASPACKVGAISELQAWRRSWMMAFG